MNKESVSTHTGTPSATGSGRVSLCILGVFFFFLHVLYVYESPMRNGEFY